MSYHDEYELVEHGHLTDCSMFLVELSYRQFHLHKELELILVLRGHGQVSNEKSVFPVSHGDVLLFDSGQIHELDGGENGLMLLAIQISRSFCKRYCPQLRNTRFPENLLNPFFSAEEITQLRHAMLKAFCAYLDRSLSSTFGCMAQLNLVFEQLLRRVPYQILDQTQQVNRMKNQERVHRLLLYIQEHFREPIRLADLAQSEGLSETHVSRFIREQLNITLQEYLTRLRVEAAMQMLQTTDLSPTSIAYECGFSDPKYLNQGFLKLLGVSPARWRAENRSYRKTKYRETANTLQHILSEEQSLAFIRPFLNA